MSIILVKNLRKYYGENRGLEEASFEVEPGEIFGFIGPNGAGKTTLIRLLLGLIQPTSGLAFIMGKEVKHSFHTLNKDIGYLPGETFFFPEMKGIDVLRFYQKMHKVDEKYFLELVQKLQLDVGKKVSEYSFGNRKKLGIIVAMLHQPKILILDEPTSGLDPLMQQIFLNLLVEEKKRGVTIFLSSHVLSEVEKVCDRIALVRNGTVSRVYTMADIHSDNLKKVILVPPATDFEKIGLRLSKLENDEGHYDFDGDVNILIEFLAIQKYKNVMIRDASLEEIFIDYYKEEDQL